MKTARFQPLSEDILHRAAGPAAYARGVAYHAERRVEMLALDHQRALARVRGSQTYQVELRSEQGRPRGFCDCRAFEGAGFCKHLVAVALAVNQAAAQGAPPTDRLSVARRYLQGQGVDALVERLLRHAIRDAVLMDEIELDAADAAEDDDALMARYRAAIDEACGMDSGLDWRGAGYVAEAIDRVLDRLEGLVAGGRPAMALKLLDHLFDEMEEAIEAVDDSDGEVTGALARAADLHLEACRQARPDSLALAGSLLEREMAESGHIFEGAAGTYAEILGPAGLAEHHRLAAEAWNAAGGKRSWSLKAILDGIAERSGDLEARIALRKDELKEPTGYIEIATLLVEAGREAEAVKWLEEALWCFEDRPDERLHTLTADLLAGAGRLAEAEALLWAAFGRWPSIDLYKRIQRITAQAEPRTGRALGLLRARLGGSTPVEHWSWPAVVILEIQVAEGLIDDAWETALAHDVGVMRLEQLADASAASHCRQAAMAYERLIEGRLKMGGAGNYDAAMSLIKRRIATAPGKATQAAYLDDLAARHKAKRTFIARLDALR
jgi:tetratricopeptide (TPR) repeat protein